MTQTDASEGHLLQFCKDAIVVHHEVTVPVTMARLDLGTWRRVFYGEFNGQRGKRLIVKIVGL